MLKKIQLLVSIAFSCLMLSSTAMASNEYAVLNKAHKALPCETCHLTATPTNIPENKTCLNCHGSMESLVKQTSKYTLNPHKSPHWGDSVPCGTCHKQHSKPIVYCEACHKNQNYVSH